MGRAQGFEVILLAGGKGSRLGELSARKDKALLSVGNHPIIYYSLKLIEHAGFHDAHVICQESSKAAIEAIPSKYGLKLNLKCHSLHADCDYGTADALRMVADKITAPDVIILSCDLVSSVPLRNLVNKHIASDASLTSLFAELPSAFSDASVPGQKAKFVLENDLVGLDEETGRLVFLAAQADLEENFRVGTRVLKAYPNIWLTSLLWDAHAYVVKKWVLDYLAAARTYSMFKAEFLPHVVKKQFAKPPIREEVLTQADPDAVEEASKHTLDSDNSDDEDTKGGDSTFDDGDRRTRTASSCSGHPTDIFNFASEDACTSILRGLGGSWEHFGYPFRKLLDTRNKVRCYAFVVDGGSDGVTCFRANSVMTYLKANLDAAEVLSKLGAKHEPVHPSAQISGRLRSQLAASCLVAEEASVADKVTMKRTVVGARCKIGDKAKIFNCVLMENCVVGEGVSLQDCIVGEKAVIGEKCDLKNCIVAFGHIVPASTKVKNEVLTDDSMMLES